MVLVTQSLILTPLRSLVQFHSAPLVQFLSALDSHLSMIRCLVTDVAKSKLGSIKAANGTRRWRVVAVQGAGYCIGGYGPAENFWMRWWEWSTT